MCESTSSIRSLTRLSSSACSVQGGRDGSPNSYPSPPKSNHKIKPCPSSEETVTSTGGNDKQNQVGSVPLFGIPIVSLLMDGKERLCLAQISSTLLKEFSYNEIHNRRVALGITCIQCTPVQLEILRRAGAMPVTSRRCGMITRREAERLCQSFLGDHAPPQLPENFAFDVYHECAWGSRGAFIPSRYNSSRAKCIRCAFCQLFFSPNKFIFHSHHLPDSRYVQPDAANFNSWRRHLKLCGDPGNEVNSPLSRSTPSSLSLMNPNPGSVPFLSVVHHSKDSPYSHSLSLAGGLNENGTVSAQIVHAWEDVKAMFNGGTRKRLLAVAHSGAASTSMITTTTMSHGDGSRGQSQFSHAKKGHGLSSKGSGSKVSGGSKVSHPPPPGGRGQPQPYSSQYGPMDGYPHPHSHPGFPSGPIGPLPLLSPPLGLESIWSPVGLCSPGGGIRGQSPSGTHSVPVSFPISFHPLALPSWLRRPIFSFSHPFGPSCNKESQGSTQALTPGGNPVDLPCPCPPSGTITKVPSSSAFKPIGLLTGHGRSPNPHFSPWFNQSSGGEGHKEGVGHGLLSLPEDLSRTSCSGHSSSKSSSSPPSPPPHGLHQRPHHNNNNNNSPKSLDESPDDPKKFVKLNPLDDGETSSDDEEVTVDIESTEFEEKTSEKFHSVEHELKQASPNPWPQEKLNSNTNGHFYKCDSRWGGGGGYKRPHHETSLLEVEESGESSSGSEGDESNESYDESQSQQDPPDSPSPPLKINLLNTPHHLNSSRALGQGQEGKVKRKKKRLWDFDAQGSGK